MNEQPRRRRRQQMPDEEPIIPEEVNEAIVPKVEIIAPTIPRSFVYEGPKYDIHTRAGLLEYIKTAIELETDLATQERIVAECQADILGRKPSLKLNTIPDKPEEIDPDPQKAGCLFGSLFTVMGIPLLIMSISLMKFDSTMIWLAAISLFMILYASKIVGDISKIKRYNKEQFETYKRQKGEATKWNKIIQQEYDQAILECDASCRTIAEEAQPHIDETRSILSRLYSMGVIYPKYCNLPALTSIYEYYMTGRCEELTGPHGAYNIYEDEMRKDTVISQLNTVIENLEQIRQNQYMLYEQVCAIQQNTAAIRSELAQIKGYTIQIAQLSALNAYYAARTERNTRILMYYHL